ncbi:hypothetical protein GGR92_001925 [Spirosoma lacussanchae]|uniref:hypothetical protein n=1 Tax=Spirosoma lacussanchae TaxID=1884249 RepID=UPI001109AF69|nr:hypothetical protein [Spirosoma lacussanchae]
MKKVSLFVLLLGVSSASYAQGQLRHLLNHPAVKPMLTERIQEMDRHRKGGNSTVSVILLKPEANGISLYLTAYNLLVEVQEHLPASFTTFEGHPFLIYDGTEHFITDKQAWFETVRAFIGNQLCDDLAFREQLKRPGSKEISGACGYIYDAPIDKLFFSEGVLVKRERVTRVPYYRE